MDGVWIALGVLAGVIVLGAFAWRLARPLRERRHRQASDAARREFHLRRERLECNFVQLAAISGKPRGLRWVDCDFEDEVTYACNRQNGRRLAALVGCTVRFEAVEGGGMEHVAAVGNLRAATAVFEFDGKQWHTSGRVVFNLNPAETIEHFRDQLVIVGQESTGKL